MTIVTITSGIAIRAEPIGDTNWREGFQPPGFNDVVMDLEPLEGKLVATGMFQVAGRTAAEKVALFDGVSWADVSEGLPEAGRIDAAVDFRGELVVAGGFVDGGNIFAWNGSVWRPLGRLNGLVLALEVYEDQLIAAGDFDQANGTTVNGIASWDGETWSALGAGLTGGLGTGNALLAETGKLYVGGNFQRAGEIETGGLAVWDGLTWSGIGSVTWGIGGASVEAFALFHDDIIIGGDFRAVAGTPARRVARWNGNSWSALGEGIGTTDDASLVHTLAVYDDKLYVGGTFNLAGGVAAANIASWDGTEWSSVGDGLHISAGFPEVLCMQPFRDKLYIGGRFETADNALSWCLAEWDGVSFVPPDLGDGLLGQVWTFAAKGNQIVAGGTFTEDGRGNSLERIATWCGDRWTTLGAGFDDLVHAVEVFGEDLVAGGDFTRSGDQTISHIGRWNGSSWEQLGEGLDGKVWGLEVFDGKLIAGGEFTSSGMTPIAHVALWNGVSWEQLGEGLDGNVLCLKVYQGELYAGGGFTIGNAPAGNLARWTGSEWADVQGGTSGPVLAMAEWSGKLAIGGYFTSAAGTPASRLAVWDGTSLVGIIADTITEPGLVRVDALAAIDGSLFVGGALIRPVEAEGRPFIGVARFKNGKWSPLGSGIPGTVYGLMSLGTTLYVGGKFIIAGDKGSAGIAVWDETPVPVTIQDLRASWSDGKVVLEWEVAGPIDGLTAIRVERAEQESGPYLRLTTLRPASHMFFEDSTAEEGREYWYRLATGASITAVAHIETSGELPLAEFATPLVRDNKVILRYRIGRKAPVSLCVYDIRGRRVRGLFNGTQDPGRYEQTWDRTDEDGILVVSGVYFVELQVQSRSLSRKVTLVH